MKTSYNSVNKILFRTIGYLLLCLPLTFTACKSQPKKAPPPKPPAETAPAETAPAAASVQVVNEWEENSMSDSTECGFFYTGSEVKDVGSFEAEFKKQSGYSKSSFGLIFAYTADDKSKLSSYVRFEITVDGEYALYTVQGSRYTDLVEKNANNTAYLYETSAVNKGYGSANRLKIEQDANGLYTCFINGTKVASGIAAVKDGTKNVMPFFSVGKKDQEKFPDKPVQVSYRILNP